MKEEKEEEKKQEEDFGGWRKGAWVRRAGGGVQEGVR